MVYAVACHVYEAWIGTKVTNDTVTVGTDGYYAYGS